MVVLQGHVIGCPPGPCDWLSTRALFLQQSTLIGCPPKGQPQLLGQETVCNDPRPSLVGGEEQPEPHLEAISDPAAVTVWRGHGQAHQGESPTAPPQHLRAPLHCQGPQTSPLTLRAFRSVRRFYGQSQMLISCNPPTSSVIL